MDRKIFIRTFGCQMNVADSGRMAAILENAGYTIIEDEEGADIVLLNTCGVRDHAEQKVWSKLGELKRKNIILGITGCMAQQYGNRIFDKAPNVNLVCGTYRFHKIGEMVGQVLKGGRVVDINRSEDDLNGNGAVYNRSDICVFVPISRGCNNKCSYCVVPNVRGAERNRPMHEIIKEIKGMIKKGCKEVTLLGQNVNGYRDKDRNFVNLLKEVNRIDGLQRIRFVTNHPKDASTNFFRAIGGLKKVCEHLHLPIQSGSNKILEKMNRGYTREHYLELVSGLREIVPDVSISTDIIVGFPEETEKDFTETYDLTKEIKFDSAFIFKYSPRTGTEASLLNDNVPADVKKERNNCLLKLQNEISLKKNKSLIGSHTEILVEGFSKTNKNRMMGRTRTNKIAVFPAEEGLAGQLKEIKISDAGPNTLIGENG